MQSELAPSAVCSLIRRPRAMSGKARAKREVSLKVNESADEVGGFDG